MEKIVKEKKFKKLLKKISFTCKNGKDSNEILEDIKHFTKHSDGVKELIFKRKKLVAHKLCETKKFFHKISKDEKFQKLYKLFKKDQSKKNYDNLILYIKHKFSGRNFSITDDNNIPMYSSDFKENNYENYKSGKIVLDKKAYECLLEANINGKCETKNLFGYSYAEHLGMNIYDFFKILLFADGEGEAVDAVKIVKDIKTVSKSDELLFELRAFFTEAESGISDAISKFFSNETFVSILNTLKESTIIIGQSIGELIKAALILAVAIAAAVGVTELGLYIQSHS